MRRRPRVRRAFTYTSRHWLIEIHSAHEATDALSSGESEFFALTRMRCWNVSDELLERGMQREHLTWTADQGSIRKCLEWCESNMDTRHLWSQHVLSEAVKTSSATTAAYATMQNTTVVQSTAYHCWCTFLHVSSVIVVVAVLYLCVHKVKIIRRKRRLRLQHDAEIPWKTEVGAVKRRCFGWK